MQERILTPEQVAQILQVHPYTVLKFIKQGKLQASKLGRVYRIRESALESFLDQTSGKAAKVEESTTNDYKKSKNKNKFPQNILVEPAVTVDPSKDNKNKVKSPEITISRVETIEPSDGAEKSGGEDEYYILQ